MKITLTNASKEELNQRIKHHESRGYKLKHRGERKFNGYNFRVQYWAVLVPDEERSKGLHM